MATMKFHRHVVTVEGKGSFPIDMLRYDGLHPSTESDSYVIARSMIPGSDDNIRRKTVELVVNTNRHWHPTNARWESFLWKVTRHEYR